MSHDDEAIDAELVDEESPSWPVYDAAIAYLDAGWTPTPLRDKIPTQKRWTNLRPTKPDCWSWWVEERHNGVGVVCGRISGNLLVVDIEKELVADSERMARAIMAVHSEDARAALLASFTQSAATTPSGGRHLYFRATDSETVPGNLKLAFRGNGDSAVLLVETRGEGGQVAAPPGDGRTWLGASGPGKVTEVTFAQLEAILAGFKSLDESGITHEPPAKPSTPYIPDASRTPSVADAWSDQLMAGAITWGDVLDPGWTRNGYDSEGRSLWVRPDYGDKTKASYSAKGFERWTGGPKPVLVVHSTSVAHLPHGARRKLTPSKVWALCYFNGDEAAANAALERVATTGEIDDPRMPSVPTSVIDQAKVIAESKGKPTEIPELHEFVPQLREVSIWDERPWLRHIHTFAQSRMVSPTALLAVVLVRRIGIVPPWVTLPPLVGGRASLNMFAALVGPSGAGKTAAASASNELMPWAEPWVHIGSGEGLVHTFVQKVQTANDPDNPGKKQWTQEYYRRAATGIVDEIDTLTALGSRQGSTLISTLRSAWSGASIGFGYADQTKRLHLDDHAYRIGLVVGAQPTRCGALFEDEDGGLPQRFMWASLTDPDAPKTPPESPGPLPGPRAFDGFARSMELPEVLRETVLANRHAVLTTGETNGLDGHALLNRVKIAAAVALMEDRLEVSADDWELAGRIQSISDATRTWVQAVLTSKRREIGEQRANARAREAVVIDETREREKVSRAGRTIARRVHKVGHPISRGEARRALAPNDRKPWFLRGLDFAEDAGWVRLEGEKVAPGESQP